MALEEYLNYEDGTEKRYELVNGVLVEMPTESPINILIAQFLLVHLVEIGFPLNRLGLKHQIAVPSSEATARDPDLTVHSEASAAAILAQKQALLDVNMPAPLIVVEVVSPGERGTPNYERDYVHKPVEYAARGIPEYWIVDPSRNVVLILTLDGKQYPQQAFTGNQAILSASIPGLALTAEQVLNAGENS
jgi:Uma2 family endonuclease